MKSGPKSTITADEVRAATELLEAVVENRSLLTTLEEPVRRALLIAAGRVAKPIRHEVQAFTKALRHERHQERLKADRSARDNAPIRVARRAAVR